MPDIRVHGFAGSHRCTESVLAGFGAAHELRRADYARLRCGLGRRGVEDHRRADHQCLFALFGSPIGTDSA